MISKEPIIPERIRTITSSFSWIDHRVVADGFLAAMTKNEIVLYFFLVLVGDRNGVSFYGYDKICALLKLELDEFISARNLLVTKSLIACRQGRFQVLALPPAPKRPHAPVSAGGPRKIKDIINALTAQA